MQTIGIGLVCLVVAYLIGSVPFAIISSKLFKLPDPRSFGSGNPGATNVLRSGSKKAAVLTLIGDAFKGWLVVFLMARYAPDWGLSAIWVVLAGLCAFLGHVYSCFLKFKGGKGVATALGVLLGIEPVLAAMVAVTWILVAVLFKYSSLAALIAAALAPFYYGALIMGGVFGYWSYFWVIFVMAIWLIYNHKKNIKNLLSGKESKIGAKKEPTVQPFVSHRHEQAQIKKAHKKHK